MFLFFVPTSDHSIQRQPHPPTLQAPRENLRINQSFSYWHILSYSIHMRDISSLLFGLHDFPLRSRPCQREMVVRESESLTLRVKLQYEQQPPQPTRGYVRAWFRGHLFYNPFRFIGFLIFPSFPDLNKVIYMASVAISKSKK